MSRHMKILLSLLLCLLAAYTFDLGFIMGDYYRLFPITIVCYVAGYYLWRKQLDD